MNKFNNLDQLANYVESFVNTKTSYKFRTSFILGSFAKNQYDKLSDIDINVIVEGEKTGRNFYFELIEYQNNLRLLSIMSITEKSIMPDVPDEFEYLWMKTLIPKTKFLLGDRDLYVRVVDYYSNLDLRSNTELKNLRKSYGKMLEYIAKIKKWEYRNNFVEMVYYGEILTEHARRIILECNGPVIVEDGQTYLSTHFKINSLPNNFKDLFLQINRYSTKSITKRKYSELCMQLVVNVTEYLKSNKDKYHGQDESLETLIMSPKLKKYLDLKLD